MAYVSNKNKYLKKTIFLDKNILNIYKLKLNNILNVYLNNVLNILK